MPKSTRIRKHYIGHQGLPKCGRHLSRPPQPADKLLCGNHSTMQVTDKIEDVTCRHCLREMKLLAPVVIFAGDEELEGEEDDESEE